MGTGCTRTTSTATARGTGTAPMTEPSRTGALSATVASTQGASTYPLARSDLSEVQSASDDLRKEQMPNALISKNRA